jgi:phospholipid/cholesterol/gamma-HCH transport system substrate-binding protein
MIKFKSEYKIALTVLTALLILLWGLNFLKVKNIFDTGEIYYGVYSELDGLAEASPVYYHGYKVGTVREISFHPNKKGRFVIVFSLNKEVPLSKTTLAQIYNLDLMGTKAVQFIDGNVGELLQPGDTLQTGVKGDLMDDLAPVKDKAEALIVKLDTVLSRVSGVLSPQNNKSLEDGMVSFSYTMQNLETSSSQLKNSLKPGGAINNSLANIDAITGELNGQRQAIGQIMENMALFSSQLKELKLDTLAIRVDSTLLTINGLLKQTQEGEGSLGMMFSDKGLYFNMMDALANLDRLLADMRHNPKRYLNFSAIDFGREVYIKVDDERAEQQGIIFKVKIDESEEPIEIKNKTVIDQYQIFEDTDGKKFIYTIGASSDYSEIVKIKDAIIHKYPDSEIIALENGKPLKLRKALEKVSVENSH